MGLQDLLKQIPEMRWALPVGGIGLFAAALAGFVTVWKKNKNAAKALPAALGVVAATLRHNHDSTRAVRQAWIRFLRPLPRDHWRSLTRFDHFLLLGGPSAGHTRLLVRHA